MRDWQLRLMLWLVKFGRRSTFTCANRWESKSRCGKYEVTVGVRDTAKPDGYSREELLVMLHTVRKHEVLQGWRVPEPEPSRGSREQVEQAPWPSNADIEQLATIITDTAPNGSLLDYRSNPPYQAAQHQPSLEAMASASRHHAHTVEVLRAVLRKPA